MIFLSNLLCLLTKLLIRRFAVIIITPKVILLIENYMLLVRFEIVLTSLSIREKQEKLERISFLLYSISINQLSFFCKRTFIVITTYSKYFENFLAIFKNFFFII